MDVIKLIIYISVFSILIINTYNTEINEKSKDEFYNNSNIDKIRFLQQQYIQCERNTGPNLDICQRSNNSTHSCCLAISRNGNSPNACGVVLKNETETRENTSYYFNGEHYFLRCISANNTGSTWITDVKTNYKYDTGIANFTEFNHNCGNFNPYIFRDCDSFSDKNNLCCFISVNAPGNKFQICSKMPTNSDNLVLGELIMNCKDEYSVKYSTFFFINLKIFLFIILVLFL